MVGLKPLNRQYPDEPRFVGMAGSPMVGLKLIAIECHPLPFLCRNGRKPDGGIETGCNLGAHIGLEVGMAGSPMVGLKRQFDGFVVRLRLSRNGRKPDGGIETRLISRMIA